MKRMFFILSFFIVLNSCSPKDNSERYHFQLIPIEEVEIPDSFTLDETYVIKLKYYRPTSCHVKDGIYYEKDLNIRTVAVQNVVFERSDCLPINNQLVEESFEFHVTSNGSYIFKFYQGKDSNGESIFHEVEVPVM